MTCIAIMLMALEHFPTARRIDLNVKKRDFLPFAFVTFLAVSHGRLSPRMTRPPDDYTPENTAEFSSCAGTFQSGDHFLAVPTAKSSALGLEHEDATSFLKGLYESLLTYVGRKGGSMTEHWKIPNRTGAGGHFPLYVVYIYSRAGRSLDAYRSEERIP
ncbi:hypothetical protein T265_03528 [Opisthorchis viverrini]|uniref:Uncharacterized protein n=1 Tax=Opisthorchis viverrini TaxID=6198 RepID=A0A075AHI4_OPIVI|nr:hypothetical protein T265_03528 [Opisthorchis viverrini]KER29939.1 hypothetical protein T265_03528 [Opisthorchis viverrini]